MKLNIMISLVFFTLFILSCGKSELDTFEEKYLSEPNPTDKNISKPINTIGEASLNFTIKRGQTLRYYFHKRARFQYRIGLTSLSGDVDLFGHWVPDCSFRKHSVRSINSNQREEQIDIFATTDGEYCLALYGKESARGQIVLYEAKELKFESVTYPRGCGKIWACSFVEKVSYNALCALKAGLPGRDSTNPVGLAAYTRVIIGNKKCESKDDEGKPDYGAWYSDYKGNTQICPTFILSDKVVPRCCDPADVCLLD